MEIGKIMENTENNKIERILMRGRENVENLRENKIFSIIFNLFFLHLCHSSFIRV
jgi:hypothetical protein